MMEAPQELMLLGPQTEHAQAQQRGLLEDKATLRIGLLIGAHLLLLFFRRELKDVFHKQFAMVLVIPPEGRWRGAGENPTVIFVFEQARGHGRAALHGCETFRVAPRG